MKASAKTSAGRGDVRKKGPGLGIAIEIRGRRVLLESWKKKTGTLLKFSSLQTLVHAVMAANGFLIVRILDKPEYAPYTIAARLQKMLNA